MAARTIKIGDGCRGEALYEALDVLEHGGLVVMPTDTVYGVAAHVARTDAVARVVAAKIRDAEKPIPLLAGSLHALETACAALSPEERALASRFWPGPLTLVIDLGGVQEGVRVPDHRFARTLIREAGGLLRVTSANISGQPPARTAAEAHQALGHAVDLVLDDGPSPRGVPSTVARVTGGRLNVLREGAISRAELEAAIGGVRVDDAGDRSACRPPSDGRPPTVVFVCTANMCRSPMAEYLFLRTVGKDAGWRVCSAGTDASDGMPASHQAVRAMGELGVDVRAHRSQILTRELVDAADLVVVMTPGHAQRIAWRFPDATGKVRLLRSFIPGVSDGDMDVPDPIGLTDGIYRAIRDDMLAAMPSIAQHVLELRAAAGKASRSL